MALSPIGEDSARTKIAVIIPCYRVSAKILGVLQSIGPEVSEIYVVDDACPEATGDLVEREHNDHRVQVLRHAVNKGVGAASLTGMTAAQAGGADILVKLDGDGQMDASLISMLVHPIVIGEADFCKGSRFFAPEDLKGMPFHRLLGNAILSFLSKLSSGYWTVVDPTNGFIAMHSSVFLLLPKHKLAERFFFESDLLFRLNLVRASVVDVAMASCYADEQSNLKVHKIVVPFLWGLLRNFIKRIVYSYFVRDFSIGSIYLMFGVPIFSVGVIYGTAEWVSYANSGRFASAGTVMLAALPVIIGFQLLLSFLTHDVSSVPRQAIHRKLFRVRQPAQRPLIPLRSGASDTDGNVHAERQ